MLCIKNGAVSRFGKEKHVKGLLYTAKLRYQRYIDYIDFSENIDIKKDIKLFLSNYNIFETRKIFLLMKSIDHQILKIVDN